MAYVGFWLVSNLSKPLIDWFDDKTVLPFLHSTVLQHFLFQHKKKRTEVKVKHYSKQR